MAFLKKCLGTVSKCSNCGKPGIFKISGKDFCQACADVEALKKQKNPK